jgi:hypothetical protein
MPNVGGPMNVRMADLVGWPSAYHGRLVRVAGYCHLEFEANGLYDDLQAARGYGGKAMWLDVKSLASKENRAHNGKFVAVVGTVDATSYGHYGAYLGTIHVQRIEETTLKREHEQLLKAFGFPR